MLPKPPLVRHRLELTGRVQGVGFRPHVYRLASELKLCGWVRNSLQGVVMELEGESDQVAKFSRRMPKELPPAAELRTMTSQAVPSRGEKEFRILESTSDYREAAPMAELQPDLAMCEACAAELRDPGNRRAGYPFIQCTDCGPRYTLLRKLPFDRVRSAMSDFPMCENCQAEYEDPSDRRFHAETICCPECGPKLFLCDRRGSMIESGHKTIALAASYIKQGQIVAVKGIGGYHLLADAKSEAAVKKLRERKRRHKKPFALMVSNLEKVAELCELSEFSRALLKSAEAPIVLVPVLAGGTPLIAKSVAPGLATLGVMLPYSPLYELLMAELDGPVVATSGNISDEPLCTTQAAAIEKLSGIADYFLSHNREIISPVDDSVVREIAGTGVVLRAARGFAPYVVSSITNRSEARASLALGGHGKNTVSVAHQGRIILMPHLGTLDSLESTICFDEAVRKAQKLCGEESPSVVCDLHPDYYSTKAAYARSREPTLIQHHHAHFLSCVAEHGITGPALGVIWDGTGLGTDGTIWGGEFFSLNGLQVSRIGHLRTFRLPGGEAAIREPRRAAFGLIYEILGDGVLKFNALLGFEEREARVCLTAIQRELNSPLTSSAGRLFDGVSALLGIRTQNSYDGQAACELESLAQSWVKTDVGTYPISWGQEKKSWVLNWQPWILGLLDDRERGLAPGLCSEKFHRTAAQAIVEWADGQDPDHKDRKKIVLSGGCFQNKLLSEFTIEGLKASGHRPFWNQRVPPNDGGISVGQALGQCYRELT